MTTRVRLVAISLGLLFGFVLAWSGMTDPDSIREMLLLEDAYLFLVMFSAIGVAFAGVRLLRTRRQSYSWTTTRPARRHISGSVLFGAGWATSLSCPGPIAAQLGQGMAWSLCTIAGIGAGILLHARIRAPGQAPAVAAVPAARHS